MVRSDSESDIADGIDTDQIERVWNNNDPVPSDKEHVLNFLKENDSRPHQVEQVMSGALEQTVLTQNDYWDAPGELPAETGIIGDNSPETRQANSSIMAVIRFQANRARVRNILELLVDSGEVERRELPLIDISGRIADREAMSEEEMAKHREEGPTAIYYWYVGDSGD